MATFLESTSPYVRGPYLAQAYYGWVAACYFAAKARDKSPERQAARVLEDAIRARDRSMANLFLRIRSSRHSKKTVAPEAEHLFWRWMSDQGLSDRSVV